MGGEIEVYKIDYLPIVRKYAEKIGIMDAFNRLVPTEMEVEAGDIVLGMILDTLSGRSPLYQLEEFFKEQDRELLFGKVISPEAFNDDHVGRTLDKIYEAGTQKIFTEISLQAASKFKIEKEYIHQDTTSVTMYGDYNYEGDNVLFKIVRGHSKNHRPDLKQFVISLICIGRDIPIFGKMEDGNSSDKKINNGILTSISKRLAEYGIEEKEYIYIADSALVTEDNLKKMGDETLFISRMPANYKEHGRIIEEAVEKDIWEEIGIIAETKGSKRRPNAIYRGYEGGSVELHGKKYRAIVIHSSAHDRRRQKRIEKEIKKAREELDIKCKTACKIEYYSKGDAEKAAEELQKAGKEYHEITVCVEERPQMQRGRPSKEGVQKIKEMLYGLMTEIKEKKDVLEKKNKEAGCFVLISNVPKEGEKGHDAVKILRAYKEQHGIEKNFGFLKDPVIVNSLFLKKPERIEALGLILLLSLLIWRLMEHSMRRHVENSEKPLAGWDKKDTKRPTSFMMTTKFSNIMLIRIGNERRLARPLSEIQKGYLVALDVEDNIFTK